MEDRVKNWILATTGTLLISISAWLAIQLYNISAKQTDMIERKLFSVQEELTRANENIIRLQEGIKAMQKENESVHAMQNFDIDDLKADNKILWNVLISDPVQKTKKKK